MDWLGITAITLATIFFVLGFLGNILPILPGAVLVFAGVLLHKLMLWDASVSWWFITAMLGAVVVTQLLDFACAWFGAKGFGATWKGGLGAVIGGILGIFFLFPVGLVVLPVVGAIVGELLHSPDLRRAGKAGVGAIIGGVLSFASKLLVTLAMIVAFYLALPPHELPEGFQTDPATEGVLEGGAPAGAGENGEASESDGGGEGVQEAPGADPADRPEDPGPGEDRGAEDVEEPGIVV